MKTVLQELMDGFDAYKLESQNESITIEKLKEVILKEYLKKEKEQIIESVDYGKKYHKSFDFSGSQYYKETFEK